MKIVIVGAGISGLTTYLFLKKLLPPPPAGQQPHSIIVYDAYPSPSRKQRGDPALSSGENEEPKDEAFLTGGGLGVAANGMRVLKALDPAVHDAVVAQGYGASRFQINSANNATLGAMGTVDGRGDEPELMIMSSRQGVWDSIRDAVPDEALSCGRAVSSVDRGEDGKLTVQFADGTAEAQIDLVVGADGVKSTVRKALYGDEYPPYYTHVIPGLSSVGGFVPSTHLDHLPDDRVLKHPRSPVVMTFGKEGSFGYGPFTNAAPGGALTKEQVIDGVVLPYGPLAMWWSAYSQDEAPNTKSPLDKDAVRRQLIENHGRWRDPVIQRLIRDGEISLMVATWVMPKLPHWGENGIVLVGDAAHALPSSSGQGVSTAVEDAQALALLLAHHLSKQRPGTSPLPAIKDATASYTGIRKPRVEAILDVALRVSGSKHKKGVIGEALMYAGMWAMCNFFSAYMQRPLVNWDGPADVERVIKESER
ncbi:MAG: hypothetical protein M1832_005847 [Thelocarpon impressellum]|nr:MAG: hypothetical protein M1832_005847 [Thelocarpon impressellum]